MTVSTRSLLKEGNEEILMDVEILEDVFVAEILIKEGSDVIVGQRVALLCEDKNCIGKIDLSSTEKQYPALWQAYVCQK